MTLEVVIWYVDPFSVIRLVSLNVALECQMRQAGQERQPGSDSHRIFQPSQDYPRDG